MTAETEILADTAATSKTATPVAEWRPSVAPAYVYLLADNLDAALAAGEDLATSRFYWLNTAAAASAEDIAGDRLEARAAVEAIRAIEMTLAARVLKSRERAEDLAKRDQRFRPMAKLYMSGTAPLIEAITEFGDTTHHDFETGDGLVSYLRSRGLIAEDAPAPAQGSRIEISDGFLIAHRIRLGTLMDLVAMFLDTLETHFELYAEDEALQPVSTLASPSTVAAEAVG